MPISFDSRLSQAYCKTIAEGFRNTAPDHKYNFKTYQLTAADCATLAPMAKKDAVGLYYNALVSFVQGCNSLMAGCVSWACVELYYSIFYATRAHLYYKDYLLIRDRGLYLVKIAPNEHPVTKDNKKYNNDHSGTLLHFIDVFQNSDFLCSNTIDTMYVYLWLMDLREATNYRHKAFNEPACFAELSSAVAQIKSDGIAKQLKEFKGDFGTFCFSNGHAWLCAPYYKLIEVGALYKAGPEKLNADQDVYIRKALKSLGMDDADVKELVG